MHLQTFETSQVKANEMQFSNYDLSENERNFGEAFKKLTEPFVSWSNASFVYYSSAGKPVSMIGEACQCNRFGGRNHFLHQIGYEDQYLGKVVLCCPQTTPNAAETLEKIISVAKGELARIDDEAALLAELSASWESLQAVYDLNTDFNSFQDPKSLLKKITERATAVGENVQTVLWLENGTNLEPAAAKCSFELESRDKNCGIVGKTFAKKRSVICNDILEAEIIGEVEPELKDARRLAIVPLTTRLATYGVLVVWQNSENFVFDSRTMRLLDTLALQAAMVVENDRLHRESIQNERLNQEIEISSKIQQTLLSGNPPRDLRGISIAAETISSQKIDGDFYDFIEHGEGCFDLIIGDVMGKGIPAALVGAATKNSFLRAIAQLQSSEKMLKPPPEKIVTWVNNEVTGKLIQFESFVTACYTRFEPSKKQVTFVDCGHTKTIHYHQRTGKISLLEGDNLPLGFSEFEIYAEKTVAVENGDILFFYSDGVTETRSPQGELFGDQRLTEFIRQNADFAPQELISFLLDTLKGFSTENKFNDDLTCVAVRIGDSINSVLRLELKSNLKELAQARQFVIEAAQILSIRPMPKESVEQLQLAVTEAVTNIIKHAYNGCLDKKIEIAAESSEDGIQITLQHWGEKFDWAKVPPPIFDGSKDGGFGLFIISNCVDSVIYSTDEENRQTILLVKKSNKEQVK